MRAHAYCVCMESRLSALADMIIKEVWEGILILLSLLPLSSNLTT